jgi:aminobenzoyl-glutamate utilization protein B
VRRRWLCGLALGLLGAFTPARAEAPQNLKIEAARRVDAQATLAQQMVDKIFSFAEPGFQEVQTSAYLEGILEAHGFNVERGVSGIPTAFRASWGTPGPTILLGSDIDAVLGASQVPGTAALQTLTPGAPGHGEGHNSGMPLVLVAAFALQDVMRDHGLGGQIVILPGVAEELLGSKAFYVRDGLLKGVDAALFVHVSSEFATGWGDLGSTGMVSVEYRFAGKAAHAAMSPWEGRSALDAVEIMDVAWNFRREHLPLTQRSHYVITNGGGQPNVVPAEASVWYYLRDQTFSGVRTLFDTANQISEAASLATGTTVSHRILGSAAPQYGNRPLAEAAWKNIQAVGMPKWSAADQAFARAVQTANDRPLKPLQSEVSPLSTPFNRSPIPLGGSDDVGDIMWAAPTITIYYPSNIPNLISHNPQSAMAMATPIAHKGVVAGAKALAFTVLDLLTTPTLVSDAKDYVATVQKKDQVYQTLLSKDDAPATWLNRDVMDKLRPAMSLRYYDETKYRTYLEQLEQQKEPDQKASEGASKR